MKMGLLLLLTWTLLLGGCATTAPDSNNAVQLQGCEEPRPQVCTMDYRPVCASLAGGGWKTFSNGCGACADSSVEGWREGACAE
jgi:hypothetical protein